MKRILAVLSIVITVSCSSTAINSVPTHSAPAPSATALIKLTTTTEPVISTGCPQTQALEHNLPIIGSLIYGDYPSNFILSFPNLITTEIRQEKSFTDGTTSPNGRYFLTSTTLYNADGSYQGDFLDVLDANGNFVESDVWKNEWTENPVWISDNEVVLSFQNSTVLLYNPFQKTTRYQSINLPYDPNLHIEALDPSFKTVVYSYHDSSAESDIGDNNNTIKVWDIKNQKDILSLNEEYSSLVSRIASSHNGKKVAITTVTPNEPRNHSEILIINNEDSSSIQLSDFRSLFDEITTTDIQWSLDDSEIYFWAIANGNNKTLFSIDTTSKQVKPYCFLGNSQSNSIVWVKDAPGFYFVTDSRNYVHQDQQDPEEWDVLLVDSKNNKAYVVAKNISILGWLTSQ